MFPYHDNKIKSNSAFAITLLKRVFKHEQILGYFEKLLFSHLIDILDNTYMYKTENS